MNEVSHPRYGLAVLLLLITGQTGLYRAYVGRTGSAVVMSGSLIFCVFVFVAAPSTFTWLITASVALVLTVVVIIDLFRMSTLVSKARIERSKPVVQPIVPEQKV